MIVGVCLFIQMIYLQLTNWLVVMSTRCGLSGHPHLLKDYTSVFSSVYEGFNIQIVVLRGWFRTGHLELFP